MKTTQKQITIITTAFIALVLFFIIFYIFSLKNNKDDIVQCDYNSQTKNYIGKSPDECSRIQYLCAPRFQQFADECGCGCEALEDTVIKTYCTTEERQGDACIELYEPVCGFFDPEKIQCVKYPCAQKFSNSCFACLDEDVLYWTEGECPE